MSLPFEVRKNIIWLRMEVAKAVITDVVLGRRNYCLICGGAGIGKNHWVHRIARMHSIRTVPEDRPYTPQALVDVVWRHRECEIILLDECDRLMRQLESLNVFKTMGEEPRHVALYTVTARKNEEHRERNSVRYSELIAPTNFLLGNRCRPIMLSNENYQDEHIISQLPKQHWQALETRGLDPVWIPVDGNDGRDLFEYTMWLVTEGRMLRNQQYTYETARDAVAFYLHNLHRLVDISPRRLLLIANAIKNAGSDKTRREGSLQLMLRDTDQRPKFRVEESMVQALFWPKKPPAPRHANPPKQNAPVSPRAGDKAG